MSSSLLGRTFALIQVTKLLPGHRCKIHCRACGRSKIVDRSHLYSVQSCGCRRNALIGAANTKHGHARNGQRTGVYKSWISMRRRVEDKTHPFFSKYGGAGIRIALRWLGEHGFENFYRDMGNRLPGMTLDRKENSKGYSKQNCRWADRKQQRNNQKKRSGK